MTRARAVPIAAAAWGAVAASAAAVARTATGRAPLAIWGFIGTLDFLIPAVTGAVVGLVAGFVLRRRFAEPAGRPVRGRWFVALVIEAVLFVAFDAIVECNDPTRLPERPAPKGPRPPDVTVVIWDAVRADVLIDDHGAIPDWAPRLKELAAGGVRFRDAVSTAPWTVPSHASLFTGLSPLDHGAIEESPHLADEFETLAETLGQHGYRTVGIVANPWLDRRNGFAQGFEKWFELWHLVEDNGAVPLFWRLFGRFERHEWCDVGDPRSDKGARWMNAFARRTLSHLRADEPLFLFVNLVDGHPPYWAPKGDRLRFVPADLAAKGIDPAAISQDMPAIYTGKARMGPDEQRMLRALNLGEVAYMDHHLGELVDDLRAAGRFDASLFALTADHGCGLGEDRLLGSGFDLREEMLRIPMVVHRPAGRDAGKTRDDLVYLHDLHPTILEAALGERDAAEVEPPADAPDARNGRALFTSAPRTGGLAAYSRPVNLMRHLKAYDPNADTSALDRKLLALRGPKWKYVWSSAGHEWLYDLQAKGEREDLGPSLPDEVKHESSLLRLIAGGDFEEVFRRSLAAALSRRSSTEGLDPESLEYLKKLGYFVAPPDSPDDEKKDPKK